MSVRQDLFARTRRFAVDAIRFCDALPASQSHRHIGGQLLRAATSVGANYRAAFRGRSRAEFLAKLGIVEEEADECLFWLEVLEELGVTDEPERQRLYREANELLAIVVATRKATRRHAP